MKSNNRFAMLLLLAAGLATGCKNEDPGKHHFENKLYISSAPVTDDLLIEEGAPAETRLMTLRMAQPAKRDVEVRIEGRPDLTAQYNMIYGDHAFALPAECWSIPENTTVITAGNVMGGEIGITFDRLGELDRSMRYVLPVSITHVDGVEVLESQRTVYFVVRGAALINVVADITKLKARVEWSATASSLVSDLETVTVEALLRSRDWLAGRSDAISSVFGIENVFLIRVGDSGYERNQLQVVSPGEKWPGPNEVKGLPVDEWVHVAIVWDRVNNDRRYYQNGKLVYQLTSTIGDRRTLSLVNNCFVGYSYSDDRWLPAQISELRIWNVARSEKEIAQNIYTVDPASPGLVAYWKFNEGMGRIVRDHTGRGSDLTFGPSDGNDSDTPTWVPVQLPAL